MSVPQTKQSAPAQVRQHGRCKFFDPAKAWGFVVAPDGKEYFVHQDECEGILPNEGQRVTFELGTDARGRRCARRVTVDLQ